MEKNMLALTLEIKKNPKKCLEGKYVSQLKPSAKENSMYTTSHKGTLNPWITNIKNFSWWLNFFKRDSKFVWFLKFGR